MYHTRVAEIPCQFADSHPYTSDTRVSEQWLWAWVPRWNHLRALKSLMPRSHSHLFCLVGLSLGLGPGKEFLKTPQVILMCHLGWDPYSEFPTWFSWVKEAITLTSRTMCLLLRLSQKSWHWFISMGVALRPGWIRKTFCENLILVLRQYVTCGVRVLSCVWPLATPWTITRQAPLSTGISRQ